MPKSKSKSKPKRKQRKLTRPKAEKLQLETWINSKSPQKKPQSKITQNRKLKAKKELYPEKEASGWSHQDPWSIL